MEKDNKKEMEHEGELHGKILKTEGEYVEGLGPVISLTIGFWRTPKEEEKENENNEN